MFDEAEAYRAVTLHLQKSIKTGVRIDAIFCTSDSMMLGCLRAIEQFSDIKRFQCPRLFSYDGTPVIQKLSESQKSHVARVVVQSPSAVAVAAIDCLENFLAQKQVSSPLWLTPSLFPSVENIPK
jgi:ABC-type sugar transport system substrate-binding protein